MNQIDSFISDLSLICSQNNIMLKLTKGRTIKYGDGIFVSGYFDEKSIACAMKHPDFLSTLVHESCHLDQFLEKHPLWKKPTIDIDSWLKGKSFSDKEIDKSISVIKYLELDCERRSLKKIRKYDLPIDIKEYIQKANAYVHFYNYLRITRKWCKKNNTPYTNKNVWGSMPDKFMKNSWYEELSEEQLQTFKDNKI